MDALHLHYALKPLPTRFFIKVILLGWPLAIPAILSAQEPAAADSVWLERARSGRLELNEKTLRAIRSGTLLSPSPAAPALRHSEVDLPLVITFDSIRPAGGPTARPDRLPPAVYRLYEPAALPQPTLPTGSCALSAATVSDLRALRSIALRRAGYMAPDMLPAGIGIPVNFENMLRYVFWPSYRAKKRNARHAQAYKSYSLLPLPADDSNNEIKRRLLNEAINEMRREESMVNSQ